MADPTQVPAFVEYGALGLLGFVVVTAAGLSRMVLKTALRELVRMREHLEALRSYAAISARELERIRRVVEGNEAAALTPRETPFPGESMPVPRDRTKARPPR
jgi:hypothetical protein